MMLGPHHSRAGAPQSWPSATRAFLAAKSLNAGAPRGFSLQAACPLRSNPARVAPSFAAQALQQNDAAGTADGTLSKALWNAGATNLLFVLATPYPHLQGRRHRARQLVPVAVEHALAEHYTHHKHLQQGAGSASMAEHARELCLGVAADVQQWGLRSLGYLLSHAFRWLFGSEVYVDQPGLERLQRLHAEGHTLVYVPTHKTHLDYLILSYILFTAGLPCPHIAAGDNLALPLIGAWLRKCGAWFIRRTTRGAKDGSLYKRVLAGYVRALLEEGHSLEFFIEGGRSRDGRVNTPKLGILSYVVDAVVDGGPRAKGAVCVPTTMSYDLLLEEKALARQLAGASKRKESLGGLLRTVVSLLRSTLATRESRRLGLGAGGFNGRAIVAFGDPIHVQPFLEERAASLGLGCSPPPAEGPGGSGPEERQGEAGSVNGYAGGDNSELARCFPKGSQVRRGAVADLGEHIAGQLRTRNVLPSSVLVAAAVEAAAAGGSAADSPAPATASPAAVPAVAPLCNGSVQAPSAGHAGMRGGVSVGAGAGGPAKSRQAQAPQPSGCSSVDLSSASHGAGDAQRSSPAGGAGCSVGGARLGDVPVEAVQRALDSLTGELELRGAMLLKPASAEDVPPCDMLLWAVRLLKGCLSLGPPAPAAVAAAGGPGPGAAAVAAPAAGGAGTTRVDNCAGWVVRREPGMEAALRWHMRLNQLLPWVAAEGLVTCALMAEAPQQAGSGYVTEAAVLRRALWLRQLLGPEIDTALSPSSLRTEDSLREVLQRMQGRGAVAFMPGTPAAGAAVKLADSGTSRSFALFAARMLAPHIATYAAVLRSAHAQLSARGAGGMASKSLLQAVQAHLLDAAGPGLGAAGGSTPVPSLMLAQHAISSLTAIGVLTVLAAGHQAALATDADKVAGTASPDSPATTITTAGRKQAEELRSAPAAAAEVAPPAALNFSPQPTPILSLPPRSPGPEAGAVARNSVFGSRRGPQRSTDSSSSSSGSDAGSDDPDFDPVAASVAQGLCGMGAGSSSSRSLSELGLQREGGLVQLAGPRHEDLGGQQGSSSPGEASLRGDHASCQAGTGGQGGAASSSEALAPAGPKPEPDAIVLLSPCFADEAAVQGLLAKISCCCVA